MPNNVCYFSQFQQFVKNFPATHFSEFCCLSGLVLISFKKSLFLEKLSWPKLFLLLEMSDWRALTGLK